MAAGLATAAVVPLPGGFGGAGGWVAVLAAGGTAAAGAAADAGAAAVAAAGREGSLIVGAEVGLGGSAIRTVSFFGCTFAASAGLGGTGAAPLGVFSDIHL